MQKPGAEKLASDTGGSDEDRVLAAPATDAHVEADAILHAGARRA